jgi:hypothetical protein
MIVIKHLIRPSYGWYKSTSQKDKYYIEGVSILPYIAQKLIRKARCVESNAQRKMYELTSMKNG